MTRLNAVATVACAILIFFSPAAFAEMANGGYIRDFSSSEVPLWDISGDYTEDIPGFGSDTYTISQDISGALTGTGNFSYDDGTVSLSGPFTLIGKVKGLSTSPRVSWKIFITGTGYYIGNPFNFTATSSENFELDGVNRQLDFIGGKVHVTIIDPTTGSQRGASQRTQGGGVTDLPTDSTGDWTLDVTLNPVPDSTIYDGTTSTATVTTSTTVTSDLTATGSYSSKTDTSNVTLKGTTGTGASLKLLISTIGSNMAVFGAKGKLYGQKVKFIAP